MHERFELGDTLQGVERIAEPPYERADTRHADTWTVHGEQALDIRAITVLPRNGLADDEVLGLSHRNRHAGEINQTRPTRRVLLERQPTAQIRRSVRG